MCRWDRTHEWNITAGKHEVVFVKFICSESDSGNTFCSLTWASNTDGNVIQMWREEAAGRRPLDLCSPTCSWSHFSLFAVSYEHLQKTPFLDLQDVNFTSGTFHLLNCTNPQTCTNIPPFFGSIFNVYLPKQVLFKFYLFRIMLHITSCIVYFPFYCYTQHKNMSMYISSFSHEWIKLSFVLLAFFIVIFFFHLMELLTLSRHIWFKTSLWSSPPSDDKVLCCQR